MAVAARAVLAELQAPGRVFFVFDRGVVALLALGTGHGDDLVFFLGTHGWDTPFFRGYVRSLAECYRNVNPGGVSTAGDCINPSLYYHGLGV